MTKKYISINLYDGNFSIYQSYVVLGDIIETLREQLESDLINDSEYAELEKQVYSNSTEQNIADFGEIHDGWEWIITNESLAKLKREGLAHNGYIYDIKE